MEFPLADKLVKAWACAGPKGQCSREKLAESFSDAPTGDSSSPVQWAELTAWLLKKPAGSKELCVEILKLRVEALLASSDHGAPGLDKVWPDNKVVMPPLSSSADVEKDALWQQILVSFGGKLPAKTCAAKHFIEVIRAGLDANSVAFPHKISREPTGFRAILAELGQLRDVNDLPFPLFEHGRGMPLPTEATALEHEGHGIALAALARGPEDLRSPVHSETRRLILEVVPGCAVWRVHPLRLLDASILWLKKGSKHAAVGRVWRPFVGKDASFFEDLEFLRATAHAGVALDMELEPWEALEDHVIKNDECIAAQLELIKARDARGPLSDKAIRRRRVSLWDKVCKSGNKARPDPVVDPRFFEEAQPLLEESAALAEMRSRWAQDAALAVRGQDEAAECGAKSVAWPSEGHWPAVDAAWVRKCRWIKMWRQGHAKRAAAAKKAQALSGPRALKRSASDASISSISSSWAVLSECGDESWQQPSADESNVAALQVALKEARASMTCVSKADVGEFCTLMGGKPPEGVKLVGDAVSSLFGLGNVKELVNVGFGLLCRIVNFDKNTYLAPEVIRKLLALEADPAFEEAAIKKVSFAAASLCSWVRAIIAYRRILEALATLGVEDEYADLSGEEIGAAYAAAVQEVAAAQDQIGVKDVQELKSLANPPGGVDVAVEAVCIICGFKGRTWKSAKEAMSNPSAFLQRMKGVRIDTVSREVASKARALTKITNFSPEAMSAKSRAAGAMVAWVWSVLKARALLSRQAPPKDPAAELAQERAGIAANQVDDAHYYEAESISNLSQDEILTQVKLARKRLLKAVNALDKKAINELKAFKTPPCGIVPVIQALSLVLQGKKAVGWQECQCLLANPAQVIHAIRGFFRCPNDAAAEKAKEMVRYWGQDAFDFEVMKRKSSAVSWLAVWVTSALKLHCLEKKLDPMEVLAEATEQLDCICKADVVEVKSMSKPPASVKKVMEAVMLALGHKKLTWEDCKALLSDVNFLSMLKTAKPEELARNGAAMRKLLKCVSDPDFTIDEVKKSSAAAAGLCGWARGMYFCAEVHRAAQKPEELTAGVERAADAPPDNSPPVFMLSKASLVEMKTLARPSKGVHVTMAAVVGLLSDLYPNAKDAGWKGCKDVLGDIGLLKNMCDFPARKEAGEVPKENFECVHQLVKKEGKDAFDVGVVCRQSRAAADLCAWVRTSMDWDTGKSADEIDVQMGGSSMDAKLAEDSGFTLLDSPCSTALPSQMSPGGISGAAGTPLLTPMGPKANLRKPSKLDICESKSFAHPPAELATLWEAMAHVMAGIMPSVEADAQGGAKDAGWRTAKSMLSNHFLLLRAMDEFGEHLQRGEVPEANMEMARKLKRDHPGAFNPEDIASKAHAAVGVCNWINDVLEYPCVSIAGLPPLPA